MLAKSAAFGSSAGAPSSWALGAWNTRQRLEMSGPRQARAASTKPSEVAEQVLASRLMLAVGGTDSRKSWTPALARVSLFPILKGKLAFSCDRNFALTAAHGTIGYNPR